LVSGLNKNEASLKQGECFDRLPKNGRKPCNVGRKLGGWHDQTFFSSLVFLFFFFFFSHPRPLVKKDTMQQTLTNMGLLSSFSITEPVVPTPQVAAHPSVPSLKIKMESMGIPPTHDDDWEQCPARTRPVWPSHLVPWWQPSQPTDKPPYTYATLVAFAILRSTDGRLLLSDIYRWIAQTYPYYVPNQRGWQVNLSLSIYLSLSLSLSLILI
jgi:hypothetical protein